jgi:WD40 repeat protein
MAITIELPSGQRVSVSKDIAVVGSDVLCDVRLAGLEPRHARIRKLASRWLIESLGAWTIQVRNGDTSRMAWLRSEDLITLTPGGVRIIFEPKTAVRTPMTSVVERKRPRDPTPLQKSNGTDRAPLSEDRRDKGLSSNEVRKKPRSTPPPLPSERAKSKPLSSSEPVPQTTHTASGRPKTTPPPLPSERTNNGTAQSSGPPPLPSTGTNFDDIRKTFCDLTETAKAAGHLAVTEVRKTKLINLTLPAAYLALGRDIFADGRFRSEFPEIYAEIERDQAEIVRLNHERAVRIGGTFAEKAGQTASQLTDKVKAQALGMKLDSLMRRLGEGGYSRLGEKSGHKSFVHPITRCFNKISEADEEIGQYLVVNEGRRFTPRRVLYGAIGTFLLVTLIITRYWMSPTSQVTGSSTIASDRHPATTKPYQVPSPTKPKSVPSEHDTLPRIAMDTLPRTPSDGATSSSSTRVAAKHLAPDKTTKRDSSVVAPTEHPDPDKTIKRDSSAVASTEPPRIQGGPPYVLPPIGGCPRVVVHRKGLQIVLKGRLWEQRLEYGGLCFTPDGKILAAGGTLRQGFVNWRGAVLLVDAASGKTITAMKELHEQQINSICFSPDGKVMATGSGGVAKAWGIDPPSERGTFEFTHPGFKRIVRGQIRGNIDHHVWSMCFSKDGKRLIAAGGMDSSPPKFGTLTAWDLPGGIPAYSSHPGYQLVSASLSPNGETLVTGSTFGRIDLWECATGTNKSLGVDVEIASGRSLVQFDPGGEKIIVGLQTSFAFEDRHTPYKLMAIGLKSRSRIWSKAGKTQVLQCMDVSPDGRLIICAGTQIELWDSSAGEIVASIDGFRSLIAGLAYSPDGKKFAASVPSGDNAGSVWVWEIENTK